MPQNQPVRAPFRTLAALALCLNLLPSHAFADPRSERAPERLWTEQAGSGTGLSADSPVTMGSFSKIARLVGPAVVNVSIVGNTSGETDLFGRPGLVKGEGTGFFVHPDGYALTNNHVVEGAREITVRTASDKVYKARVIGRDPRTDLALIKVDGNEPFPVAPLGDSSKVQVGEWVLAIGNPLGLSHTVTAGIVSAVGRSEVAPQGRAMYASFIQTDASINPGNSGGPLVNIRGEVIGINAAIRADGQGIGFAIPANMAKKVLPQLAHGRVERSFLGVSVKDMTPELARSLKLDRVIGAVVAGVLKNSPAAEGGVKPGDVILAFDGSPVHSASDLPWLAASAGVRQKVPMEVVRDGRQQILAVNLRALPRQYGGEEDVQAPEPATQSQGPEIMGLTGLGLAAVDVTPALRKRFLIFATQGALVVGVDRGGPADLAGVSVGDVIVRSGQDPVGNVRQLDKVYQGFGPGDVVPLLVQRGKQQFFVAPKRGR
jgi:serine protease Do